MKILKILGLFLALVSIAGAQVTLGPFTAGYTDAQYPLHAHTDWRETPSFAAASSEVVVTVSPPAPPADAGQWQFIQVLFHSTDPSAVFAAHSLDSDPYLLDASDSLPVGNLSDSASIKRISKGSSSGDFSASRYPTEIYFVRQAPTMSLRFRNVGNGNWKVKVRAFYLKKPAETLSQIAGSEIRLISGGITPITLDPNESTSVVGGQSIKLKVLVPGESESSYDKVQILDNSAVIGDAVWENDGWVYSCENIEQGNHYFKAYFIKDGKYKGWSPGGAIEAEWFKMNVAFGIDKSTVYNASGSNEEVYLGDKGDDFNSVRNGMGVKNGSGILHQFLPERGEWTYGWSLPGEANNTPVKSQLDSSPLYDSYCRFRTSSGLALKWEATVPTGIYKVRITAGDASNGPESYRALVEGREVRFETVSNGGGRAGWHDQKLVEVEVTDGRLTIESPYPAEELKLNFVNIQQISFGQQRQAEQWNEVHQYGAFESLAIYPLSGQKWIRAVGEINEWGINFSTGKVFYCGVESEDTPWPDSYSNFPELPSPFVEDLDGGAGIVEAKWSYVSQQPFFYFGRRFGGNPLSTKQSYSYELDAGILEPDLAKGEMRLRVFNKATGEPHGNPLELNLDRLISWQTFPVGEDTGKGLMETFEFPEHSLRIDLSLSHASATGKKTWIFTHRGGNPEYVYCLESLSKWDISSGSNSYRRSIARLATEQGGLGEDTYSMLFAFSVDETPALTVATLTSQFEGKPQPLSYYGTSPQEIKERSTEALAAGMTMRYENADLSSTQWLSTATLANLLSDDPSSSTSRSLDKSPELRTHTLLNEFIVKMKSDPLALANYVQNEIGLTDAIGYNQGYDEERISIDPAGVQRGALGCFLEGQGSPHEQCALLIYLLRKVGVPSVYVKADRNRLLMDSSVVSKMLLTNLKQRAEIPSLVALNYPWVAAYMDTDGDNTKEWVHLFPWIKDVEIQEGADLYSLMPRDFNTGWKWVWQYFQGYEDILPYQLRKLPGNPVSTEDGVLFKKSEVFTTAAHAGGRSLPIEYQDLSVLKDFDQPYQVFPRFVKWQLQKQDTDIAYDQIGLICRPRPRYYSSWADFPKPTVVRGNLTALRGLNEIPRIFDTIRYEIVEKNPSTGQVTKVHINSGDQLLCDLHNRKVYVERWKFKGTTDEIGLVMAPFDSFQDGLTVKNTKPYDSGQATKYPAWSSVADQGAETAAAPADLVNGRKGRSLAVSDPGGNIELRIIHKRQRNNASRSTVRRNSESDLPVPYGLSDAYSFTAFIHDVETNGLEYVDTNKISKGLFALCIQTGKVSKAMLEAHVRELWKYESNSWAATEPIKDISLGTRTYLMGMSYWEYLYRFKKEIGHLHKVVIQGDYGHLFAGLKTEEGFADPSIPSIDIYRAHTLSEIYNTSIHPGRQQSSWDVTQDFYHLLGCQGSAYEHGVMEKYYGHLGAVSTMRLFHLAKAAREEARAANNPAGVAANQLIVINSQNKSSVLPETSLSHEIEGRSASPLNGSDLTSFKEWLDVGFQGTRGTFALSVLAPKYYKYFDNEAIALECAGMAPVPDAGTMGGYIAPLSKVRQYKLLVQASPNMSIDNATPPTLRYYGKMKLPVVIPDGQPQVIQHTVSGGQSELFSVEPWVEPPGTLPKQFRKWMIYKNTSLDENLENDVFVESSTAAAENFEVKAIRGKVSFPKGDGSYIDVSVADGVSQYQVRVDAVFVDPIRVVTHEYDTDGFSGGFPDPDAFTEVDLRVEVIGSVNNPAFIAYRTKRQVMFGGQWNNPVQVQPGTGGKQGNPSLAWVKNIGSYVNSGVGDDRVDDIEVVVRRKIGINKYIDRYYTATGVKRGESPNTGVWSEVNSAFDWVAGFGWNYN